jgi:hypothetical protein
MKKYFIYNGEYISGWAYWLRTFLQTFLIYAFGLGFYLWGVTTYTRAKSLGFSNEGAWAFAIILPISWFIALAFAYSGNIVMVLVLNIPHWYLWFKDGKSNSITKDKLIGDFNSEIEEKNNNKEEKSFEKSIKSEEIVNKIDQILNENPVPKSLKIDAYEKSDSKKLINGFNKKLQDLTKPNAFMYDYKYWYKFIKGRADSIPIPLNKKSIDFVEEQAWAHCDEYSKRLFSENLDEKLTFIEPRIICYGKIFDLLVELDSELKSNNSSQKIVERIGSEVLHGKASLYGAIKFAQKNNISNDTIKKWYPNFNNDVENIDSPFLEKIRPHFVGADAQSKLYQIYDLDENEKNEVPFWLTKGLFIFGFFKKGKTFKNGSKSVKLNRIERTMFFHYQQFCMLFDQLPEFNDDGSYLFGKYEFYIESNEIKELIIEYFQSNNKNASDFLKIKK